MTPTAVLAHPPVAPVDDAAFALRCHCSTWIGFPEQLGDRCKRCRGRMLPIPGEPQKAEPPPTEGAAPAASNDAPRERVAEAPTVAREALKAAHPSRVTKWQPRNFRQRPTEWVPPASSAAELLGGLGQTVARVFMLGPRPSNPLQWATSGELPRGWEHDERGHYLEGNLPVWRFRRDDQRVTIHRAASWFGDGDYTADDALDAWRTLNELVGAKFKGGSLASSPSATGRHLFQLSIPYGREWPVLSDDDQELIRSTSGQGRIELFERRAPELPQLVEYDARWSYAALCWGLGAGVPVRDTIDQYEGHQRGRYLVAGHVPEGWDGPGLIGEHDDDGGWRWPNEPGQPVRAWCDGAELLIAQQHGWALTIHERLLFPAYDGKGPLDPWCDRLKALRAAAEAQRAVGSITDGVAELVVAGVRSILLHTIGAFHGRGHKVTRVALTDAEVPRGVKDWRMEGEAHLWAEDKGQAWETMGHPEWSAAIWARARARLLDCPTGERGRRVGMLHVPRAELVACRTDAIYLTRDPGWPDDGAIGRFRLKRTVAGPLPYPNNHTDLLRLKGDTNG